MWTDIKLKNEVDLVTKGTTPTSLGKSFTNNGIPFLRAQNVIDGKVRIGNDILYIDNETHNQQLSRSKIYKGDVLLTIAGTIGRTAIVNIENDGLNCNQAVAIIRIGGNKLDANYLCRFLASKNAIKQFNKGKVTATISNLSLTKIKNLNIPLPPLATQKKIAAILDAADEYRQKTKALLEKYDQLTQSIFLDMFGDPVRNEKGWEVMKLDQMGICERGKSKHRPRNAPELLGGEYPLIQTGDVSNSKGYISKYNSTYSEFGLKQSRLWPEGTLCITIAANIAKTGILEFDACFPDSIVGFKPNLKCNSIFIQHWMSFLQKIIEDKAPESAQKNINLKILRELDVICPPIEMQVKFKLIIDEINLNKRCLNKTTTKSENLFQSLLQKAFKGELVK